MTYVKYLLLIIYFFSSSFAFSCGALNGKGLECNLYGINYNSENFLLDDKVFFYFKNKEVYQVYLYSDAVSFKLKEINLGEYILNSDLMTWNKNQYLLNRKNFKLRVVFEKKYYFSCVLLGRPLEAISNYFKKNNY